MNRPHPMIRISTADEFVSAMEYLYKAGYSVASQTNLEEVSKLAREGWEHSYADMAYIGILEDGYIWGTSLNNVQEWLSDRKITLVNSMSHMLNYLSAK